MKTRSRIAAAMAVLMVVVASLLPAPVKAAPARPQQPQKVRLTDGTTAEARLMGDEWCHWTADMQGRRLINVSDGLYRYATEKEQQEWTLLCAQRAQRRDEANARRMSRLRTRAAAAGSDSLASHYAFPTRGKVNGLIVLVEYQDVRFQRDLYGDPLQQYTDMMTKEGYDYAITRSYSHYGSAHDYFYQNSFGAFDPQFDVYGPLLLKHNRAYYGENVGPTDADAHPEEMIIEACEQLDSLGIDFAQYDNDNDGFVDFVFAIFAGHGENAYGEDPNCVWPHAWNVLGNHIFDGKKLMDYACTSELYSNHMDGVGTFCHEFSHVLGLPDLYDINYVATTPYNYDVLDNGCYRHGGCCPAGFSAYERFELGWVRPEELGPSGSYTLLNGGTTNQCYLVPVTSPDDDPREGEYYLFENRQKTGWDTYLPGHGLLIWHIDYVESKWWNNKVNTWVNHPCIDLVEADGPKATQTGSEPFPGNAGHTSFTNETTPAFCGWEQPGKNSSKLNKDLGLRITDITETEGAEDSNALLITFNLSHEGDIPSEPGDEGIEAIYEDTSTTAGSKLRWCEGKLYVDVCGRRYDLRGVSQ